MGESTPTIFATAHLSILNIHKAVFHSKHTFLEGIKNCSDFLKTCCYDRAILIQSLPRNILTYAHSPTMLPRVVMEERLKEAQLYSLKL